MTDCYICLESCPDEQSPCQCKSPIHYKCFAELTDENKCTICREAYIFEDFEVIQEQKQETIVITKNKISSSLCPLTGLIFILFGGWYVAGLMGKIIWILVGGKLTYNIYEFWNWEHLVWSIVITSLGTFICYMFNKNKLPIIRTTV